MDWTEPKLLERTYRIEDGAQTIVVRLGFPRTTERKEEWACSFQIVGWRDGDVHVANGVNGLSALTNAAAAIRRWLDDIENVHSDGEAYEFVFPRYVPTAHGLEYHRNLCKVLDEEIEKKEHEIEAKWASRREQRNKEGK